MENTSIDILGAKYEVEFVTEEKMCDLMLETGFGGCCCEHSKKIYISTMNHCEEPEEVVNEIKKNSLRHEVIHAFLSESGLSSNALNTECWAKNEEMVDWIALQFPKILKVYTELGIA